MSTQLTFLATLSKPIEFAFTDLRVWGLGRKENVFSKNINVFFFVFGT